MADGEPTVGWDWTGPQSRRFREHGERKLVTSGASDGEGGRCKDRRREPGEIGCLAGNRRQAAGDEASAEDHGEAPESRLRGLPRSPSHRPQRFRS